MTIQFTTKNLTDVQFVHWTYGDTGAIGFTDDREELFQEPYTDPPYDVVGKGLQIVFLHGRQTAEEEMSDWGFHGGALEITSVNVGLNEICVYTGEMSTTLPIVDGTVHITAFAAEHLGLLEGFYGDFDITEQQGA